MDNRIANNKKYVRSDETVFALVYPAVVREILTRAVIIEGQEDWDNDAWQRCQFQHYLRTWRGAQN